MWEKGQLLFLLAGKPKVRAVLGQAKRNGAGMAKSVQRPRGEASEKRGRSFG
jgi:hypothetical protein